MKATIQEINAETGGITEVTGILQSDSLDFSISNSYQKPFSANSKGIFDIAAQIGFGGGATTQFGFQYVETWESATPPEVEISILFRAKEDGASEVMDKIVDLTSMFGVDLTSGTGRIVPPAGYKGGLTWDVLNAAFVNGDWGTLGRAFEPLRIINVFIGDPGITQINLVNLLPTRIQGRCYLPIMNDGVFGLAQLDCSFRKKNLLTRGDDFFRGRTR